jgi:UDP-N-acetylmuramoyl-tripeptide--D-alanyl-D-alanine ligase
MGWTFTEILKSTGARTCGLVDGYCETVCTDSRKLLPGCLFVALVGPNHDGHEFVAEALKCGAEAALVQRLPEGVAPSRAFIVPDSMRALGDLAAFTRRHHTARLVAITGSNGKTTTKEMIASVCRCAPFPSPRAGVLKTLANENNLIGVPLTLLRLTGDDAVAVIEMGMNASGEIARLTEIADPDVGVITNVGPAHLEGLGSVAGVAAAKGELFAGMRRDATIAVNAEDEWVSRLARDFPGRQVEFGCGCEVEATAVRDFGLDGIAFDLSVNGRKANVRLRMCGLHNVTNALAAAAVAHALGLDLEAIRAGLAAVEAPKMRMEVFRLANGVTVVNDGYNANPASVEAALRTSAGQPGRLVAVLGEMRELGAQSTALHRAVGRLAATSGAAVLIAVGPHAEHQAVGAREGGMGPAAVHVCEDPAAAAAAVTALWQPGDVVLLKGSRGADTEEAVRRCGSRMAEVARLLKEAGGGL